MSGYNNEKTTTAPQGEGHFESNLLNCFGGGFEPCIITWFLPCYTYALIEEKLQPQDSKCLNCCGYCCNVNAWCFLSMQQRKKIQKRDGLVTNGCTNCCVGMFCTCCSLIQNANQVKAFDE